MNKTIRFLVKKTDEDKRIDIFLSEKLRKMKELDMMAERLQTKI